MNKDLHTSFLFPIDDYLERFDNHLICNERIIFSAKFGEGKSYFLNKFKQKYDCKYKIITLYPVNYQVENNKDIFELIKRDILIQMVSSNMIKEDYEISESIMQQYYITKQYKSIFLDLLETIPNIDGAEAILPMFVSACKIVPFFQNQYKNYLEYKKCIEENKDENIIENFINSFDEKSGSIYEHDAISKIIIDNINSYRLEKEKKIILIIEDLDRIDPNHLFRILNMFSAHVDRQSFSVSESINNVGKNKYSFDNIVTVCDFDNTENIFQHFYGKETNFKGYINKFMSHNPFVYSINEVAINYFYDYINTNCHISSSTFKNTVGIYKKIPPLSVRDIQHILHNLENQINNIEISGCNSNITYKTLAPITRFIAILRRIGFNSSEITNVIKNLKSKKEMFNCINTFLLNCSIFCTSNTITYENGCYFFNIEQEQHIVTSLSFIEEQGGGISSQEIRDAIENGITNAMKYVYC